MELYRWAEAGDTCVDVGAHIRVYTTLLAHRVGRAGVVISLEPSPSTFSQLIRCVDLLQLEQVVPIAACASDKLGRMPFQLAIAGRAGPEEESMRVPAEGVGNFKLRVVPCTTVEEVLRALEPKRLMSVLKIDVEGAEPLVLKGATIAMGVTGTWIHCPRSAGASTHIKVRPLLHSSQCFGCAARSHAGRALSGWRAAVLAERVERYRCASGWTLCGTRSTSARIVAEDLIKAVARRNARRVRGRRR